MSLLFELLQVSLGHRSELSHIPSQDEWSTTLTDARRQDVEGILFCGLDKLPQNQKPPISILMTWVAYADAIEARNAKLDARCLELLRNLSKLGLRATILKGQGLARLYGDMRGMRQCNDIDVFVDGGMEKTLQALPSSAVRKCGYKHAELKIWRDTEVELHYRVEFIYNLHKNRQLQIWFDSHKEELFHTDGEWVTPSLEINLFYILLHIYRHFFYQGIELRQLIDYYFCLLAIQSSNQAFIQSSTQTIKHFGMERFAKGLMWVMGEVLAMPRDMMPWPPDKREGKFILEQILAGGNFSHHAKMQSGQGYHRDVTTYVMRHKFNLLLRHPVEALSAALWIANNRIHKPKSPRTGQKF